MRKLFSKLALVAVLGLALTFASCFDNDDDDDLGGSSSSSVGNSSSSVTGGGGSFSTSDCLSGLYNGYPDKGNDIANYKTIQIGDQIWMAENLNYNVKGRSYCYLECMNLESYDHAYADIIANNCAKYGRLYDWSTAMAFSTDFCNSSLCDSKVETKHQGICPSGWHIPSVEDWEILIDLVSNSGSLNQRGIKLKATSGWNNYGDESGNGTDDYDFSALPGGVRAYSSTPYNGVGERGYWWSSSESGKDHAQRMSIDNSPYAALDYVGTKKIYNSVRCIKD